MLQTEEFHRDLGKRLGDWAEDNPEADKQTTMNAYTEAYAKTVEEHSPATPAKGSVVINNQTK